MAYKHLFGPVPSRRLGISLGVDLVPHKVCSLNCVYCEVGKTTDKTIKRKEYVPIDEVINELDQFLGSNPELDYVTFSGAGEPTLNSGLGKIIKHIKKNYPQYKLALLTNATLFYDDQLREEILPCDLLLPSLDAISDGVFKKINRPEDNLSVEKMIAGLIKLKEKFKGEIWLEIFLIHGINDIDSELTKFKEILTQLKPERIQLNSLDRPGTEEWVEPITEKRMNEIKEYFSPLSVEIIAKFKSRNKVRSYHEDIASAIIETISRRPCTDKDLSEILGLHINELNKYLSYLTKEKRIEEVRKERGIFFKIRK